MALTVDEGDPRTKLMTSTAGTDAASMGTSGTRNTGADDQNADPAKRFFDSFGEVAEFGREDADTEAQTYLKLYDETGAVRYLTIDSSDVITASGTKP